MFVHQFLVKYMGQIRLVFIPASNIWQSKLVTLLQKYCSKEEEEEEEEQKKQHIYNAMIFEKLILLNEANHRPFLKNKPSCKKEKEKKGAIEMGIGCISPI